MRTLILLLITIISIPAFSQQERDTVYKRCPLFITDTVSANNFFIEGLPATIKTERDNGEVKITIQQKEQFFTMFFRDRKLKTGNSKQIPVAVMQQLSILFVPVTRFLMSMFPAA
jgi:hypothetical protein